MTTALEIVDTAVKVGFEAMISGVTAWVLASQAAETRRLESTVQDMRSLLKDFSRAGELVKVNMDIVAHAYYNNKLEEAREALVRVSKELRTAQALANIIDNKKLLDALETAVNSAMEIYHELRETAPELERLKKHESTVFSSLEATQPEIASEYRSART